MQGATPLQVDCSPDSVTGVCEHRLKLRKAHGQSVIFISLSFFSVDTARNA